MLSFRPVSDTPPIGPPPAAGAPTPATPPPAPPHPPGFDQAHVDRIAATARRDGRESAAKDLAEKLGMSVEDAEKRIKEIQDAETQRLSEADKKFKEAADIQAKATAVEQSSQSMIVNVLKRDALWRLGMTPDQADVAKDLVKIEGDLTAETAVEKVTAAAQQVKTTFPQLFEASTSEPGAEGSNGETPPAAVFPPRPVDSSVRGQPPVKAPVPSNNREKSKSRLRDMGLLPPAASQ